MAKKRNTVKKDITIVENIESISKTEEVIKKEEEIKKHKVKINYIEDNAIVFTFAGYSRRLYFDLQFRDLDYLKENKNAYKNKILNIYYIGDLSDMNSVKFLPLKSLSDIGDRF